MNQADKLGRTPRARRTQIANRHLCRAANGPTEAANNLAKPIKRTSFGTANLDHHRTRILLHAGKPDQTLLDNPTPRQNAKSPQSVGRVGSSADNAVAEAFFSSLKRELVHRRRYPDRAAARRSIFEWLTRYNTTRRHTSLDNRTPDEHEAHYRQTAGTAPALTT